MCSAAVLLLVKFGGQAALASRRSAIATMATAEEYEVVGMREGLLQGRQCLLRTSGPQALGPSRPCPAREGQWNSLRSQVVRVRDIINVAVGRDSLSIIDTTFRLASRLHQVLYNETRLKLEC